MTTWAGQETAATEFAEALAAHGGPAFPASYALPSGGTFTSSGMTLRDYFAGRALVAMDAWAPPVDSFVTYGSDEWHVEARKARAAYAYAQADAMLAERSK